MQVYLVGGAVRDALLELPVVDRDYVVVGSSSEQMLAAGYQQVGKDFPVFLHPKTAQEYALARVERKVAAGYGGFSVEVGQNVTLEQDLLRRDLTINAIAQDENGQLIDPYGGLNDLEAKLLRHVSPAFVEDPLRVLRVARFAARYHQQGFRIADTTFALMSEMASNGELTSLTPERVWQEIIKVLSGPNPRVFFELLLACGALQVLLPELAALAGVAQVEKYHPEIDSFKHVMLALDIAELEQFPVEVVFAVLVHDLGKGITPDHVLPQHIGHEKNGLPLVEQLCQRLKVPRKFQDLAKLVCRYHLVAYQIEQLRPATVLKTLDAMDCWRRPERLQLFLQACECDKPGRLGHQQQDFAAAALWQRAYAAASAVTAQPLLAQGLQGKALGEALRRQRALAIKQSLSSVS